MRLVQVSTLFVAPRLRSSRYVDLLLQELPHLASNDRHGDPGLPSLRNIVLIDNISGAGEDFHAELSRIPNAIDFRDALIWREDGASANEVRNIRESLHKDEVINLQFTRYRFPLESLSVPDSSIPQRNYWAT